jgi:hypothetical protein
VINTHKTFETLLAEMPNPSVNRTAEKLRFSVPSALRAPAAGYLQR